MGSLKKCLKSLDIAPQIHSRLGELIGENGHIEGYDIRSAIASYKNELRGEIQRIKPIKVPALPEKESGLQGAQDGSVNVPPPDTKPIKYSVVSDAKNPGAFTVARSRTDGSGDLIPKSYSTEEEATADIPNIMQRSQDQDAAAQKNSPEAVKIAEGFRELSEHGRADGIIAAAAQGILNAAALHTNSNALAILRRQKNGTPVGDGLRDTATLSERIGLNHDADAKQFTEYLSLDGAETNLINAADKLSQRLASEINDNGFKLDEVNAHSTKDNPKIVALHKAYKDLFQNVLGLQKIHYPVLKDYKRANPARVAEMRDGVRAAIRSAQELLGVESSGYPSESALTPEEEADAELAIVRAKRKAKKDAEAAAAPAPLTEKEQQAANRERLKKPETDLPVLDSRRAQQFREAGKAAFGEGTGRQVPGRQVPGYESQWYYGYDTAKAAHERNSGTRTAGEAATSAANHLANVLAGGKDAMKAILDDLAKKTKEERGSFSNKDVDEESYTRLEPIFSKMWKEARAAFQDTMEALESFYNGVVDMMGDTIEPYITKFYRETKAAEGKTPDVKPETKEVAKPDLIGDINDIANHIPQIAERILPMLREGKDFSGKLTRLAAEWYGVKQADILTGTRTKTLQEGAELAIVQRAREIVADKALDVDAKFEAVKELYAIQPNLSERTSTSMMNQAYSTPAPISFTMQEFLDLLEHPKLNVYEPTAGTGMLVYAANPMSVSVNEIGADRLAALNTQGLYEVTTDDGRTHISGAGAEKTFSRVVANPPFGAVPAIGVDGFPLAKLEHQIMADALSGMTDTGKSAFIIGGHNFNDGKMSSPDRIFLNWLYSHYNVVHNIDVNGDVYAKQGTKFPIRVIAIDGRKPIADNNYAPKQSVEGAYKSANTVDELRAVLRGEVANGTAAAPNTKGVVPGISGGVPAAISAGDIGQNGKQPNGDISGDAVAVPNNGKTVRNPAGRDNEQRPAARNDGEVNGVNAVPAGTVDVGIVDNGDNGSGLAKPAAVSNQHQTPYKPTSKGQSGYTLVPKNSAESLAAALERIAEENGGDIDEFVRKELQYDSKDIMFKSLAAEQIDALAMALNNIKSGRGMIIGDMTGIGKGRVVAGVIRYALLNGKVPIFVTEGPKLFSDMWRDIVATGSADMVKPLLVASDKDGNIVDEDGTLIQKMDGGKAKTPLWYRSVATQGKAGLEAIERNAMFITYSQLAQQKGGTNPIQRAMMEALAPDSIMILDESHNAGGEDAKATQAKPNVVSRGQFMRSPDVIGAAHGVVYSSATFAKRPDNMALYFRTALGASGMSPENLTEVMKRGGVALQQFVSAQLTKAGDMIRREQDFSKIARFERKVVAGDKQRVYDRSDSITEQVRDILGFGGDMVENFPWDEAATENGQEVTAGEDGSNVGGTDFSSGVHNLIAQMQLSLKADAIVEEAITALKGGFKPVIGLQHTMGSFLKDYMEQAGLVIGDEANFTFNDVLVKMLTKGLRYQVEDAAGKATQHYVTEEQLERLAPDMFREFSRIKEVLRQLPIQDMPASPLDYIKQKIADAGYTIREITGRQTVINDGVLTARDDKDRNTSVNLFNNGGCDVLLINRAGATGLSLHPTLEGKDNRPRRMIIAQADLNIDTFVQMLGRIFRKGQIHDPEYIMLSTALPSEKRPAIVVEKKMQSMNANTSANDQSGFSSETPDMVNQYGDQVVWNWLQQNRSFGPALNINLDGGGPTGAHGDLFKKATGHMGLMAAVDQENFWDEITDDYITLVEEKDALGQNDLVAKNFDFQAETVKKTVIHQGDDETNPFTASAVVEEIKATMPGKPYTSAEIQEKIDKVLDGKDLDDYKANLLREMDDKAGEYSAEHEDALRAIDNGNHALAEDGTILDKKIQRSRTRALAALEALQLNHDTFRDLVKAVALGKTYQLSLGDGETMLAVPYDIRIEKGNGNPLAPSKIKIMYAIPNGNKMLTVGMNRKNVWDEAVLMDRFPVGEDWDALDGGELRKTRHVITGNVLQGFSALTSRAQLITFTRNDGTTDQGILLPSTADVAALTSKQTAGPQQVSSFLAGAYNRQTRDQGNDITIMSTNRGDAFISVPYRGGKKWYFDAGIIRLTGEFRKSQGRMTASFPMYQIPELMAKLDEMGTRFTIPNQDAPTGGTPNVVYNPRHTTGYPSSARLQGEITPRGFNTSAIRTLVAEITKDGIQVSPQSIEEVSVTGADADALRKIAAAASRNLVFVRFASDAVPYLFNGAAIKGRSANIYLNIESDKPHLTVLGHELFHSIGDADATAISKFFQGTRGAVKPINEYKAGHDAQRMARGNQPLSLAEVAEEFGADLFADQFSHPAFWSEIAKHNPSLAQRLLDGLVRLMNRIKHAYSGTSAYITDLEKVRTAAVTLFESQIKDIKRIVGNEKGLVGEDINADRTAQETMSELLKRKMDEKRLKIKENVIAINLADAFDGFRKIVRPSGRSEQAKQMEAAMLVSMGKKNRGREALESRFDKVAAQENLKGWAKAWDNIINHGQTAADVIFSKMGTEKSREFMQAMDGTEEGKAAYFTENPHLEGIAEVIDAMFAEKVAKVRSFGTGAMKDVRENYFPHIWKKMVDGVDVATRVAKNPIEGSKSFAKHRVFEDVSAGLEAGYTPVSDNPINLVFMKMAEMDKYITIHEALQAAERADSGIVKLVVAGEKPAKGWAKIKGVSTIERNHMESPGDDLGIGRGKTPRYDYHVKEDVAQLLNNYTSQSMWSWNHVGGIIRGWRQISNVLNRWQLGVFSLFHAGFTTGEAMVSHFALGFKAAGDAEWSEAGHYFKTGFTAGYSNPKRGVEVLKDWRNPDSDSYMNRLLEMAGASFAIDHRFFTNETQETISAIADKRYLSAAWHGVNAVIEQSARPIMEHLVPAQKAGVFAEMADYWLKRNPDVTQVETAKEMQQIWNRIDSRLGQVVYDRLFAHNVAKNIVQLLIRAPGWTGGTILEVGGGLMDFTKSVVNMPKNGGKLKLTDRAAYTMSLLVTTSIANMLMTALMAAVSGKDDEDDYLPHDWRDMFAFRTGNVDEFGNPERFMLPTYMKDMYHYAKDTPGTLVNKLHPMIGLTTNIVNNKDYYGVEVRHPGDNPVHQTWDTAKFVAKAFVPFWMRGMAKEIERGGSLFTTAMPFVGVMPAPKKLNQTAAEIKASELSMAKMPERSRTQEEADRGLMKSQLGRSLRLHPGEVPPEVRSAMQEGKLTDRELKSMLKRSNSPVIVNQLSTLNIGDALEVWEKADDKEKVKLKPVMQMKIRRLAQSMAPADWKELEPKLKKAGLVIPR